MKKNELLGPEHIGILGADAVIQSANTIRIWSSSCDISHAAEDDVFFFGIVLQSQDCMGIITLDLGLYGATVVLFHIIISIVHLWFGGKTATFMKFREFDWRQSSVRQILSALSQGLEANSQAFDDGGDIDDALEYEDDLCGIAFVTAQAYITRVVADVNLLRGTLSPIKKHELLESANPIVADTTLTRLQLCDTMANYYKHRDEWADWTDPAARRTTDLLRMAGFTQGNQHLYTTVATLLFGNVKVESLVPLVDMLSSWRVAVIASAIP